VKTIFVYFLAASVFFAGVGCGRGPAVNVHPPLGLGGTWYCAEIIGPVNSGPGVCPDCTSELCVEVTSENLLTFAVEVDEELEYSTELCELSYVLVKQSSTTLFEGDIGIMPLALEPGAVQVATKAPIVSANPSLGATIEVEGLFGRPACD
jgi:hypothetical protein